GTELSRAIRSWCGSTRRAIGRPGRSGAPNCAGVPAVGDARRDVGDAPGGCAPPGGVPATACAEPPTPPTAAEPPSAAVWAAVAGVDRTGPACRRRVDRFWPVGPGRERSPGRGG